MVGYTLGTRDSMQFMRACRTSYYPSVVLPLADTPLLDRTTSIAQRRHHRQQSETDVDVEEAALDAQLSAGEAIRVGVARDLLDVASLDVLQRPFYESYPAHMHIDLLPVAQGSGIGRLNCF